MSVLVPTVEPAAMPEDIGMDLPGVTLERGLKGALGEFLSIADFSQEDAKKPKPGPQHPKPTRFMQGR